MASKKQNLATIASIILLSLLSTAFAQQAPPARSRQIDKLIAVLQSDAPLKQKFDACRQLAIIGDRTVIQPLAELLTDEKLSHMVRYALEPIPDPAVDKALRDALTKAQGRPLVGIIASLGVRRDPEAVQPLAPLLKHPEPDVANTAARALGSIGTPAAADALSRALGDAPARNKLALCQGLLRCAEALAEKGHRRRALQIYDQLRAQPQPHQIRAAALRGSILLRSSRDQIALLRSSLRSNDYILFSTAVQTAQQLPDIVITKLLAAELPNLPPDNQILVIQTLAKRADPAALPAIFERARSGPKSVRLAAIRALPEIGHPSVISALAQWLEDPDLQLAQAARKALAALASPRVDSLVMKMLRDESKTRRLIALQLIGRRRMRSAVPDLLLVAGDPDPEIRRAALARLAELAGPDQLRPIVKLLLAAQSAQDIIAAERAVTAILSRTEDPRSHTSRFAKLLTKTGPEQRSSLLRILAAIGGPEALEAVRRMLNDPDSAVRTTAVRVLCGWTSPDVVPELLALAKNAPDPAQKTAALRSYINFIRHQSIPLDRKLQMARTAAELIKRTEETKLLLGALGQAPSPQTLQLALKRLDNPSTSNEAGFAVVAIAEKIQSNYPDQVLDALQKVIQSATNKDIVRRAKALRAKISAARK